jgi:hypothetical protein
VFLTGCFPSVSETPDPHQFKLIVFVLKPPTLDGTILFRQFPVRDANSFSSFVRAFNLPQPHKEIGLAGIRTLVTTDVKTANEEPPDVKFYYHSEYGRSAHFPAVLFFYSDIVPHTGQKDKAHLTRRWDIS